MPSMRWRIVPPVGCGSTWMSLACDCLREHRIDVADGRRVRRAPFLWRLRRRQVVAVRGDEAGADRFARHANRLDTQPRSAPNAIEDIGIFGIG
jgi:hypothetical protein